MACAVNDIGGGFETAAAMQSISDACFEAGLETAAGPCNKTASKAQFCTSVFKASPKLLVPFLWVEDNVGGGGQVRVMATLSVFSFLCRGFLFFAWLSLNQSSLV